jgi:hypothetical protein
MAAHSESYSYVPKSNNYEIFTAARNAKALIKVTGCVRQQDKLKDVMCYGHIKSVEGREAFVNIVDQEVLSRPCKIYPNEFEYFFCLDKNFPERMRLGFLGTGKILNVKKDSESNINVMHLRFAAKSVERRMRRDTRVDWQPEYSKVAGVIRLDSIPADKHDLKNLIQQHYRNSAGNTQIVNISAAGACALLPDEAELKSLSPDTHLMLYILSDRFDMMNAAYIFLGKKIGVTSSGVNNMLKLRMQFTHELDLHSTPFHLDWEEISNTGSLRLASFIDQYCNIPNGECDFIAGA